MPKKTPRSVPCAAPRPWGSRLQSVAVLLVVLLMTGGLFAATGPDSAAQGDCPEGSVLSSNGVTCELDVGQNDNNPVNPCPDGQQLNATGLLCEDIADDPSLLCPAGQELDDLGLFCVDIVESIGNCPAGQQPNELGTGCEPIPGAAAAACDDGFSLGADGVTCIADGPRCQADEILNDQGECAKTFQCPAGMFLASDLLSCRSDNCPEGELLSVDGKRCVAPDSNCPDGSPRPIGGSCLVVETIEGDDGVEVIVRCDASDSFCQAQVKECAEDRASGADSSEESCEDPRTSCDDDDEECVQANDRLVNCATRDDTEEEDADPQARRIDPCDDLCPRLHRLDASGECVEYLDPRHPCVSFGKVPAAVTTNRELDGYSYLAGTGQCVTRVEFLRRLGNFEAAAGAEADALAILRETTSEYLTVEDQLAELEAGLINAERDVRQFTTDAADADANRAQNEKDLLAARKVLQREMLLLQEEVVQIYISGGREVAVEAAILGADDLIEVGLVKSYGEALLDDQIDNIERIRELESATVSLGLELERAAAEVQSSLDSAIVASADLESLLEQTEDLREEQLERRNEEAEIVSQLREDKGRFAQELGVFDQASREIADIISESEFLVTEFRDFDGLFANPLIPAVVISGFGPRLHPILGYVRNHNGLDLDAPFGEPIYASAPGIVQISSTFGGYGETVVLDHGGGLLTLYAHQSVLAVEVGDEVQRGDVIGFIGSTGLSTGPHLHFEVWVDGRTAVDPLPYLTDLN